MFDRIVNFFSGLPDGSQDGAASEDEPRIAAAALMFHVMDADGVRDDAEADRVKAMLAKSYGLSGAELETLARAGEAADREAVDFYAFTSVLMRHLDYEARVEFIEIMWEVVLADGEIHELEDNIVWRVAELLGVDSRDRVTMRQRVQARMAGDASK